MGSSFLNSSYNALASGASYATSGVSSGLSYVKSLVYSEKVNSDTPVAQEISMAGPLEKAAIAKEKLNYDPQEYLAEPPTLTPPSNFTQDTHSSIIIAEMIARTQKQALGSEESATLKFETTQKRLQTHQQALNAQKRKISDKNLQAQNWESKERLTNYMLSGATFGTGLAVLLTGNPTGGYLMVSGAGSAASQIMQDYNFSPAAVTYTSLATSLFSLGGGFYHLFNNPQAIGTGLEKAISYGSIGLNILLGSFKTYTTYQRHENLSEVMKLEALSNIVETRVKILFDKFPGIASTFQNTTKSASGVMKGFVKAHKRSTDATKMVLAAFAG